MTELGERRDPAQPLADLAVVEIDGEFTPYAGRLLADLGATVNRVVTSDAAADVWWPMHRGKRELTLDPTTDAGRLRLTEEIAACDILVRSGGVDATPLPGLEPEVVRAEFPGVIHVILTPYGLDGPGADQPSTDLTRLAAGGLLWLGGYPDAEPVAPYGEQSTLSTGIFGVVAILLAVIERDRTGTGCLIEVSAQEVLVQALETSLSEYEMNGTVRQRAGSAPREAGTGIYPCADGFVSMVTGRLGTAKAWGRLREWLVETGTPGADELWQPDWESLPFRQRPESIARFAVIFGDFTRSRSKRTLYEESQRRNIALAPVNAPHEVLQDVQLAARGYLQAVTDPRTATEAVVPGPAFRIRVAVEPAVAP